MNRLLASSLAMITLAAAAPGRSLAGNELFISEYIEGSSYNKAVEIYNSTSAPIDLSAYELQFYFNGSNNPGRSINLAGTLAQGDVFVIAHSSADAAILAQADQTDGGSWYNGDDAVLLLNGGVVIDAIGQLGVDPGSQWGSGDTSTQDNTLVRMSAVDAGDNNAYDSFDPSLEWQGFANNTFDNLGSHTGTGGSGGNPPPPATATVLINEVDADTSGSDTLEFVELYDGGVGNTDLSGHVVVLYNGNGDTSYAAYDLNGYSTDSNGYFVIGNAAVSGVDLVIANNKLQNGADAVALYSGDAAMFPDNTPVTTSGLLDALVYDTNDADDAGLLVLMNNGQPQVNEHGGGNKDFHSNQRCSNGSGGTRNSAGYVQATPTPGQANQCGVVTACGAFATPIHTIQGSSDISPEAGNVHTVEAVVVGDFQDTATQLSGFFLQEETADQDANAMTSEGIFVADNGFGVDVNMGDRVRVTGTVNEYFGLTELNAISEVTPCGQVAIPNPQAVNLPFSDAAYLERLEGMRVSLPQTLTVTENYNLGRYGEVLVSSGGRLFTPTNLVSPGSAAIAQQAVNDLNQLVIDDGSSLQNPDPIAYPSPGLSAFNTLRSGDTVTDVTGVISYTASAYRLHPTQTPVFTAANPRSATPGLSASGSLRVASFNVLNYFNGDGQGGGFPTARGASTAGEFTRQRDKIISAISAMQADIIGLMEIENDGYGSNSAIQDLVNGLNAAAPVGTSYAFVNPGVGQIGSDQIAVGLIYRVQTVQPLALPAILDASVDARFDDTKNRPVLAQTFSEIATNARFTVAVNHLKSKGSSCASIGDPDTGDGQGNCNLTRTRAAEALVDWLATDPTQSNDADRLIIGDLNSYAMEDPISAIKAAGYTDMINTLVGNSGYSYVFKGQSGYLDHALASSSLATQVSAIGEWHINADEPRVLDYNEEFKTAGQVISLYNADAYRASDHDPVVIELNLAP